MCGQEKGVAREHLSWKCFCVCQTEMKLFLSLKMVNTTWKTWQYLFMIINLFLMKSMDVQTQTES